MSSVEAAVGALFQAEAKNHVHRSACGDRTVGVGFPLPRWQDNLGASLGEAMHAGYRE